MEEQKFQERIRSIRDTNQTESFITRMMEWSKKWRNSPIVLVRKVCLFVKDDFREEFLREIAIQILNNYDIYKERGEKLLYEDMHDTWADDFWSDPLSLKISGYDQIESAFWDMDEKSQEMRYNIVLTESKPRDKVCCCSEEKYIELLKSAAVRL